jgi:hypothetical protein
MAHNAQKDYRWTLTSLGNMSVALQSIYIYIYMNTQSQTSYIL